MKLKTSVTLMVALVLGLVTAKVGTDMLKKYRGKSAAGVNIVTAKRDFQPGHVLEATDLKLEEVAPSLVPPRAVKEINEVVGRTVITQVAGGQAIFEGLLAPKGAGIGWQAMVPPGMRAVTVDVSESSAVAGMLIPGCKVDVITTLRRGDQTIAKAIVENVRVQYVQRARSGYTSKGGEKIPIDNGPVKTVTLLVTPKQASAIELSNSSGSRPRLVLRGNSDSTTADDGMISSKELMGIEDEPPAPVVVEAPPPPPPVVDTTFDNVVPEEPSGKTITIIRGSQEETKTFLDEKKEEGSGATPTADKSKPAGAEPRTASGDSPGAPRRTEVHSISR